MFLRYRQRADTGHIVAATTLALSVFVIAEAQPVETHNRYTTSVDGVQRSWRLYVPDQYEPGKALPMVVEFHASSSTPDWQGQLSTFETLAASAGFFIARPEALYTRESDGRISWNVDRAEDGVDDVRFVRQMIDEIRKQYTVDPNRIYATGFSGGARMSSRLACDLSDLIAAVGPVAGIRYPDKCSPSRPVPVIAFHGKQDGINPYDPPADSPAHWRMSVEDAIRGWVDQNECRDAPSETAVSSTVTRISYRGCAGGAAVDFYRSDDGGHTWPGTPLAETLQRIGMGFTNSEVDATRLLWEFFARHPMD